MKTPANVMDLYLEAWLNKQYLSGFGLSGTRNEVSRGLLRALK